MVGLKMTSSKRAYVTCLLHPEPLPLWQATADQYLHRRLKQRSRSVSLGSLGLGVHKVLFVRSKSLFPQSCASSVIKSHWPPKSNSLRVLSPFARSLGWESVVGPRTFLRV